MGKGDGSRYGVVRTNGIDVSSGRRDSLGDLLSVLQQIDDIYVYIN